MHNLEIVLVMELFKQAILQLKVELTKNTHVVIL